MITYQVAVTLPDEKTRTYFCQARTEQEAIQLVRRNHDHPEALSVTVFPVPVIQEL